MATGPNQKEKEIKAIKDFVHERRYNRFQVASNKHSRMFFDPCADEYIVTDLLKNRYFESTNVEEAYEVWAKND